MLSPEQQAVLIVLAAAAVVPLVTDIVPRVRLPVIVVEILAGIVIGPHGMGWVTPSPALETIALFGMVFLFFLAGLEIDFTAIRGRPLRLAVGGWLVSLFIGLIFGWLFHWTGAGISHMVLPVILTTTTLGALMPILRDEGLLPTRFGAFVVAAATVGELGPVVLIAVVLTADTSSEEAASVVLLVVFSVIIVLCAYLAKRVESGPLTRMMHQKLHTSAQLPVRLAVLVLAVLVILTRKFGLDAILGAIAAGVLVGLLSKGKLGEGRMGDVVREKLEAIGFGFLVPIFLVTTGVKFDLPALTESADVLLRVPLFLLLFLIARGVPVVLYRKDLPRRDLVALGLFSATTLPLVVAITGIGVRSGHMTSGNASALVGAGMLSMLVFPAVALAVRRPDDEAHR